MNSISDTAYYCCGVRAEDAKRERPVCNDRFAERFMDERGRTIFEPFKSMTMANISNVTRCRLIDDFLRKELARDANISIVTIGAGYDTRPYRLAGGHWIEIDEPQILHYKEERLPTAECANPLRRITINFSVDSLAEKLEAIESSRRTAFVLEGVFMYLDHDAIRGMIAAMQQRFPVHVLYCDLMTRRFFDKVGRPFQEQLTALGARFTERPDDPQAVFLEHGYELLERIPMVRRATELGVYWDQRRIPRFLSYLMLNVFMQDLAGYAVHRFEKRVQ